MSVTLTLIYPDGSTFLVGGFPSKDAAEAWAIEEQTRPYWNPSTQIQIEEK